jgi:Tfp pilus assembly protein PilN
VININLLPGAAQRSKRRLPRLSDLRPKGEGLGLPSVDRWLLFVITAWIAGPLLTAWLFFGVKNRIAELEVAVEGARLDSIRYAEMRAANEILMARRDSIAQKLNVIHEIDGGRYAWVHVLDEIARALPPYTWLINVVARPVDNSLSMPKFVLEGRTGNTFGLTEFMQELEASPFLRSITLITTDQVREGEVMIYSFVLEGEFQPPPPDLIETVPIFPRREGD